MTLPTGADSTNVLQLGCEMLGQYPPLMLSLSLSSLCVPSLCVPSSLCVLSSLSSLPLFCPLLPLLLLPLLLQTHAVHGRGVLQQASVWMQHRTRLLLFLISLVPLLRHQSICRRLSCSLLLFDFLLRATSTLLN
jgi:hypothetical protein